ncbi:MAG: CmcI family methyltransferase, partial [Saprospiraceae bacterium]
MSNFSQEVHNRIEANGKNANLVETSHRFMVESVRPAYSYNFSWLGRPIIQYPQDMVAMQELIWQIKPD